MPDPKRAIMLDRAAVAERVGLSVHAIDTYRYRPATMFPDPDDYVGRTPLWRASTIDRWNRTRRRVTKGHQRADESS